MNIPLRKKIFLSAAAVLLIAVLLCGAAAETEEYAAQTMRLLQYTGDVQILDAEGSPRFVMENVRFSSGETMMTGESSLASVGLDESKIVTVDELSSVEFIQQEGHILLSLKEGTLLLDVEKKLDENEAVDIQTSTMTVGIRGTIVGLSVLQPTPDVQNPGAEKGQQSDGHGQIVMLWMMAGVGHVEYVDSQGNRNTFRAAAGTAVIIADRDGDGTADSQPGVQQISEMTVPDCFVDYLRDNPAALQRVTEETGLTLDDLANGAGESLLGAGTAGFDYAASGDWRWPSKVTLVAQSATKMYDGKPLSRPDVLVDGLPVGLFCSVAVAGEQTDAGSSGNVIKSYAIYNANNENVTDHFTNIETVNGTLTVEKAQLTVWTDSAEKTYDGTPLTAKEAKLHRVPGYEKNDAPWKNSSFLVSPNVNEQTLYGICGTVIVHGKSPLTGATQDIPVSAGEKLTIYLNSTGETIRFEKTNVAAADLPLDLVKLYLDNPDLLAQACEQTGWTKADIEKRKTALGSANAAELVSRDGLNVSAAGADSLILDFTDVQIHVDSSVTNYDGRALGPQEAKFISIPLDPTITVTATGSQTDVGTSKNGYEIKWGDANKNNYTVVEDLGTLTVYPAALTVTTGSAAKAYDGTPLSCEEASVAGLVGGETATVTATGSQTEVGASDNTYTLSWGTAKESNYTVTDSLGTLTVTEALTPGPVSFTARSASKIYDGTPLTVSSATAAGLPEGYTFSAVVKGSQTDAGAGASTVVSWTILDPSGADVTASFSDVSTAAGTLKVNPAPLTVTTGSASKAYDGTALTATAGITGLVNGETATATATGSQTDVGTSNNTYTLSWGTAKAGNYTVTETLGTLEVTANTTPVTFTAASASKTYDGAPLTDGSVTAAGLPAGYTCTAAATGTQTDAGSSDNTVSSYAILKDGSDVTANFSNVSTAAGTLTVSPAPLTLTTGSASKAYDGTALTAPAEITGLVNGETATATATGSQTNVGTSDNTYTLSWGTAKAGNYTVTETLGTLEVTANTTPITFTAASAGKTYDGSPLTDGSVTAAGLPAGFAFTAAATGTQTDAGSSDNTVSSYAILKDGSDVTANFSNVSTAAGTLTVSPAPLTVNTGSASKAYDGTALTAPAEITGLVNGETATATATGSQTDVGTSDNTYTLSWGTAKAGNYSVTDGEIGTLEVTANNTYIVITSGTSSGTYTPFGLKNSDYSVEGDLPAALTLDVEITGFQEVAGTSNNTIAGYTIKDQNGDDKKAYFTNVHLNEGTLTLSKAKINVWTSSDTQTYKGSSYQTSNVSWTGVYGGDNPRTTDLSITDHLNSWVRDVGTYELSYKAELIREDLMDKYEIGETKFGTFTITPAPLTVTAGTASKVYDGTPLQDTTASLEGLLGTDAGKATVSATATITDAGSVPYTYEIDWGEVNSNNYTVSEAPDTLTVDPLGLKFDLGGKTMTYGSVDFELYPILTYTTGNHHTGETVNPDTIVFSEEGDACTATYTLFTGDTATLTVQGAVDNNNVGEYSFTCNASVSGTASNYDISYAHTTVTIKPLKVTIKTESRSKTYDGKPYPQDTEVPPPTITIEDAPGDFTIMFSVQNKEGQITNAGSVKNDFKIDWGDENPDNYEISEDPNPGTLTITKATLTVSTPSGSHAYDGNPYTLGPATVTGLVGTETVTVNATGSQTEPGSSPNTYEVIWEDGTADKNNYEVVNGEIGTLTVF